ncbi:hypothetical protein ACFPRL_30175 [Pseudoclavibacter helvolus]
MLHPHRHRLRRPPHHRIPLTRRQPAHLIARPEPSLEVHGGQHLALSLGSRVGSLASRTPQLVEQRLPAARELRIARDLRVRQSSARALPDRQVQHAVIQRPRTGRRQPLELSVHALEVIPEHAQLSLCVELSHDAPPLSFHPRGVPTPRRSCL